LRGSRSSRENAPAGHNTTLCGRVRCSDFCSIKSTVGAPAFPPPGSPEAVARLLAQATPRGSLSYLFSSALVGAVSVERVGLPGPMIGMFRGPRFQRTESGRRLPLSLPRFCHEGHLQDTRMFARARAGEVKGAWVPLLQNWTCLAHRCKCVALHAQEHIEPLAHVCRLQFNRTPSISGNVCRECANFWPLRVLSCGC